MLSIITYTRYALTAVEEEQLQRASNCICWSTLGKQLFLVRPCAIPYVHHGMTQQWRKTQLSVLVGSSHAFQHPPVIGGATSSPDETPFQSRTQHRSNPVERRQGGGGPLAAVNQESTVSVYAVTYVRRIHLDAIGLSLIVIAASVGGAAYLGLRWEARSITFADLHPSLRGSHDETCLGK